MSCLRSSVLARRTMASSARSIMRLETNHSDILNFLWGVFGWQKWSGMAASPRVACDHASTRFVCVSIGSVALPQREQIDIFVRFLFVLDLHEREGAHRFARAARMQRAKRLADRAVLEGAADRDESVQRMIAERGRECDLLFARTVPHGDICRAQALFQLPPSPS